MKRNQIMSNNPSYFGILDDCNFSNSHTTVPQVMIMMTQQRIDNSAAINATKVSLVFESRASAFTNSSGMIELIRAATARPPSVAGQGQILHNLWLELQQQLRLLSENSEFRSYETGHYPQLQSPELVIEAIQEILGNCDGITNNLPTHR